MIINTELKTITLLKDWELLDLIIYLDDTLIGWEEYIIKDGKCNIGPITVTTSQKIDVSDLFNKYPNPHDPWITYSI